MMSKYFEFYGITILVLVSLVIWTLPGCDNTMNAFDEEAGLYSIYGYLDVHEDVNYLRVRDLNTSPGAEDADEIDAEVEMVNLKTGASEVLQDSVVQFEEIYTHNFRTTLDIDYDTPYEVTVTRSDGAQFAVQALTPSRADSYATPMNEDCETPIELRFERMNGGMIDLEVGVVLNNQTFWANPRDEDFFGDRGEDLLSVTFIPQLLLNFIFGDESGIECYQLESEFIQVRYTHLGPGFFDPTETGGIDVPGGFDRFGGLYRNSYSFPIDTTRILL